EPASAPTSTGMSYLRPFASTTFSNRNALRWLSGRPRNCRRTSGCSSVSLLIGTVTRTSLPARSSASTYWPSVGQYDAINFLLTFRVLSALIGDRFQLGHDGRRRRHDVGDDPRHRFPGLRIEVEIEARDLLAQARRLDHVHEGAAVDVDKLGRHSGRTGERPLDRSRRAHEGEERALLVSLGKIDEQRHVGKVRIFLQPNLDERNDQPLA